MRTRLWAKFGLGRPEPCVIALPRWTIAFDTTDFSEPAMITLRPHSPDPHVLLLQRLLNDWLSHEPGSEVLVEDCNFGRRTEAALRRFQTSYTGAVGRLTVDGIAGANTWRALGLQTEINHPVPRVGQSTGMSCWVVAGGLATGRMTSAIPGLAEVAPINDPAGGGGGLEPSLNNLDRFALSLQMHLHP
ncbi:MAG: peptidoglycan-binding protein, partial [Rhodobacteraceae bacterium]|nr:peptidoglycan-binding protein [Paracoccaceae bacterium]